MRLNRRRLFIGLSVAGAGTVVPNAIGQASAKKSDEKNKLGDILKEKYGEKEGNIAYRIITSEHKRLEQGKISQEDFENRVTDRLEKHPKLDKAKPSNQNVNENNPKADE